MVKKQVSEEEFDDALKSVIQSIKKQKNTTDGLLGRRFFYWNKKETEGLLRAISRV
jgi:hypothetical protein